MWLFFHEVGKCADEKEALIRAVSKRETGHLKRQVLVSWSRLAPKDHIGDVGVKLLYTLIIFRYIKMTLLKVRKIEIIVLAAFP